MRNFAVTTAVFFASITVLAITQGCGDVRLSKATQYKGASSGATTTYLKPPSLEDQNLRLVVFVDMSNSMVINPCPADIEDPASQVTPPGPTGTVGGYPCNPFRTPADPQIYRLKSAKKWITDLMTQLPAPSLARLKILIVPFTGGYIESARDAGDIGSMVFLDGSRAVTWIDTLIQQQIATQTFQAIAGTVPASVDPAAADPLKMGTSVPSPRLNFLKVAVSTEIDLLKASGELKNTNFQVAFMSDGNPVPNRFHMMETLNRVWASKIINLYTLPPSQMGFSDCIGVCQGYLNYVLDPINSARFDASEMNNMLCSYNYGTGNQFGDSFGPPIMGCPRHCIYALGAGFNDLDQCGDANNTIAVMRESWGNEQGNTPLDVIRALNQIRTLLRQNSEAHFNFHFLMSDLNRIGQNLDARPDSEVKANWILFARKAFKRGSSHGIINSDQTPLDFFALGQVANAWHLKYLFAINTTARVDRYGQMAADSDSDGLYDYEDSSPNKPRTNGICLDAIRVKNGCISPGPANEICDPEVDQDGDGLNDCEEKTLGTDAYDFDTDNDGIPDGFEILFGLNPLQNDREQDWSGDGVSNFDQFAMGLSPQVRVANISAGAKVAINMLFSGYQTTRIGNTDVSTAGYAIRIANLPIANVAGSNDLLAQYSTPQKLPAQRISPTMVGGSHAQNFNRILIVGFVESETNPGMGYWIGKVETVGFGASAIPFDLGSLVEIFARDPLGDFQ